MLMEMAMLNVTLMEVNGRVLNLPQAILIVSMKMVQYFLSVACDSKFNIVSILKTTIKRLSRSCVSCFCPDDCQMTVMEMVYQVVDSDGLTCTPESSDGVTADNCVQQMFQLL